MKPKTVRIRLDRPGVVACGPYRAGVEYDVSEEEAAVLIHAKGFTDLANDPPATLGNENQED